MKKWISVILATVTLCTMCTVLPAGAVEEPYAYVYENFEDGVAPSGAENKLVAPGVGDFGYAVRRTITATSEPLIVSDSLDLSAVAKYDTIKFSAWVRPKTATAFSAVNFYLYGYDEEVNLATKTVSAPVTDFAQDEWSYVETTFTWDLRTDDGIKWADNAESLALLVEAVIPGGATTLTYDIDDIIVEPMLLPEGAKVLPNIMERADRSGNFDSLTPGNKGSRATGYGWSAAGVIKAYDAQETAPVNPGTNKNYLQITGASTALPLDRYSSVVGDRRLQFQNNRVYKISYWVKPVSNAVGATQFYPGITIRYDLTAAANNDIPYSDSGNNPYGGIIDLKLTDKVLNIGQWNKVEYYLLNEYRAFFDAPVNMEFRLFAKDGTQSGKHNQYGSSAVFYYDEIMVEDLGSVSNGDFELGNVGTNNLIRNRSRVTQSVLGWQAGSATLSQTAATGKPGAAVNDKALLVDMTTSGGALQQGLSLETDKTYTLSFWAKGVDLTGEVPMSLKLDRNVTNASESYDVPAFQDITVSAENNPTGVLTNEWQYYTATINNTFPLKTGLTEPGRYTLPRLPWLQFVVGDNAAGIKYMVDDVEIKEYDPEEDTDSRKKAPYCTAYAFTTGTTASVGQEVGVTSFTYASDRALPQGTHLLRVLKKVGTDEWAQVAAKGGTTAAQLTYTIPAELAGQRIRLEFVPMDNAGHFGEVYAKEYDIDLEMDATATFSGNGTTTPISVSVDVANTTAASKNITVILALYDANNTMLDIKSVSVPAASGLSTVPADPMSTALTADLEPTATMARVYVLDGTPLANAGGVVWKVLEEAVPIVPAP